MNYENAREQVPVDVPAALKAARRRIERPGTWTRWYIALTAFGLPTDPDSPSAVCWCARGALDAEGCFTLPEEEVRGDDLGEHPEREPWWWLKREAERAGYASIEAFNDAQPHAEVLALFDRAIARAEAA